MATGYYAPVSYGTAGPTASAAFTIPKAPALAPALGPPLAPGGAPVVNPATAPTWAIDQSALAGLNAKYAPQLSLAQQQAKAGLAGLGGYTWGTDNPATPEDESLNLSYDPNHSLGERERKTVLGAIANTRSTLLGSSFANRNIGAAMQQLSDQARQTVMQFASTVFGTLNQQQTEQQGILRDMAGLYGTDISYYTNPDQPWNAPNPGQYLGGGQGIVWQGPNAPTQGQLDELGSLYPGMNVTPQKSATGGWYVDVYPAASQQEQFYQGQLGAPAPNPSRPYKPPPSMPFQIGNRIY